MRTLIHLSDLHFGRIDAALIGPLIAQISAVAPDLVLVSGDLTQRARSSEFQAARVFLDALPAPWLAVPGNHDVPLYDVARRLLAPLAKYRHHVCDQVEPMYVDDEIVVLGINTARALTIKDGRINLRQMALIRSRFAGLDPGLIKIIVSHHPFDLPAPFGAVDLVGRAALGMATFADCGVDLLLAGHVHASHVANSSVRHQIEAYAALMVQAGTATSTRGRGESNSFNVLQVEACRITVQRYSWHSARGQFSLAGNVSFVKLGAIWSAADALSGPDARSGRATL